MNIRKGEFDANIKPKSQVENPMNNRLLFEE
jgi:hypothetical protein